MLTRKTQAKHTKPGADNPNAVVLLFVLVLAHVLVLMLVLVLLLQLLFVLVLLLKVVLGLLFVTIIMLVLVVMVVLWYWCWYQQSEQGCPSSPDSQLLRGISRRLRPARIPSPLEVHLALPLDL